MYRKKKVYGIQDGSGASRHDYEKMEKYGKYMIALMVETKKESMRCNCWLFILIVMIRIVREVNEEKTLKTSASHTMCGMAEGGHRWKKRRVADQRFINMFFSRGSCFAHIISLGKWFLA